MEIRVLGPLQVRINDGAAPLGGPKQRALLALLSLYANEVISRDRLIEGLWGGRPPASAQRSLDSYVSRLRTLLGPERIKRRPPGYVLRVGPGELDLDRFDTLLDQGRCAAAAGDPKTASERLRQALALWRGPALADLVYEPFAAAEIERLDDRRLLALEELAAVRLALGEDATLVADLTGPVRESPDRSRLLGQLMLALYRAGRQTEALAEFRRAKERLREELGLDPEVELQELEQRILKQDPSLLAPTVVKRGAIPRARRRRRGRPTLATGVIAVAAVAIVGFFVADRHGTGDAIARSNELVGLAAHSGRPVDLGLSGTPAVVASGGGSLWVSDANSGSLIRVDPSRRSVVDRIPIGGSPGAIAVGGGFVWTASVLGGSVERVDPATGTVSQTIPLGGAQVAALAFGRGALWVADSTDDSLLEIDPVSGVVERTVTLDLRPTALLITGSGIWVADYEDNEVAEIDPESGQPLETIDVGTGPVALALAGGDLWVANALDSTVARVDPTRGAVVAVIPVGSGPTALAATGGSVWVANEYASTISQIDSRRGVVTRTMPVGGQPTSAAVIRGRIWVGVRPAVLHRGGTLRLVHARPLLIDPALQEDLAPPAANGLTGDGLVTYDHVSGPAGTQIVPDLALSIPTATDSRTIYTFRLRPGIRYSDGRAVHASDFRRALERVFNLRSYGAGLLTGVDGAASCLRTDTKHCDLNRGVVADDKARTVTFHLDAPDPDFLVKLAWNSGLVTPVPPGTPLDRSPTTPIPGTGPYEIARANQQQIRYVRNPYFHEWSHAAQPAGFPKEIVWRFGASPAEEVREVEHGTADWMADAAPGSLLAAVAARRPGQLHTFPTTETDFFVLNTTRPPFDDARVRRALNFALDRRAITRIYGGEIAATPTCQVLPPGIPGYRRYCPYTVSPSRSGRWIGPDLPRARRLVAESGTRGEHVTVWGWLDDPTIAPAVVTYTAKVLRRLGFRTTVRLIHHSQSDRLPLAVRNNIQLIPDGWTDATPEDFIPLWLSCRGAHDHGYFCDPALDRMMRYAEQLQAANARAGAAVWARIDHDLVDRAAWVPLVNNRQVDFVSPRVANFQHHPYWDVLADQFVVK